MLARRPRMLPALPSVEELDVLATTRLDAMFARPRASRSGVWAGLASAALGCAVGVLATLLYAGPAPALASLTPQQQTLYSLVQDLAQADTPSQHWVVMARIERVVKALHPPPRPSAEPLLPQADATPGRTFVSERGQP